MKKKKLNNYKRIKKANSTKPRKQYKNKMSLTTTTKKQKSYKKEPNTNSAAEENNE